MKFYGGKKKSSPSRHAVQDYNRKSVDPARYSTRIDHTASDDRFEETFESVQRAVAGHTAGQKANSGKRSRRGHKTALIILSVVLALLLAVIIWGITSIRPPKPTNNPSHATTAAAVQTSTAPATGAATDSVQTTDATTASTEAEPDIEKTEDELLEELAAMAADIDVSNAKQRDGVFTVLLVGTDIDAIRTDTIVMVTLDTNDKSVAMLNIPRDTMSADANGKIHKINAAFNKGIKRTIKEVTNLVGYEPNRHVIVDYDAFEKLIDAIGGVEINVPKRMYYNDPDQNLTIDLQPGVQRLDGKNALDYMRFRKGYANQDLGRIEAQQGVYKALIEQLATPAILLKIPALAEVFFDNVETDLTIGEIIWLATQFYNMDTENITTDTIPTYLRSYNSQSYVVASTYKMLDMINDSFNPYETDITNVSVITPPASTKKTTSDDDPDTETDPGTGENPGGEQLPDDGENSQPPEWIGGGGAPATTVPIFLPEPVPEVVPPSDPGTGGNSVPPAWLG